MKKVVLENLSIKDLELIQDRVNEKIQVLNSNLWDDMIKIDLLQELWFDLRKKIENTKNSDRNKIIMRVSTSIVLMELFLNLIAANTGLNGYESYLLLDLAGRLNKQIINL
ncbi:hypothetical protein [Flavobacterium cerinum]|uniref:Uncharacterized protein n=1 Tax=Flavobacterium cerinum TaxID=2502784 RepID=A0ABY5IRX3_9FLAO|nr:hypothetical protein [Flavobacterium cerinum]UUC45563.1 hypothetical protein NOX80_18325 [Flavobacterium cerinum]